MARCPDLNALAEVIGPRFAQVAAEHDESDAFVADNYAVLKAPSGLFRIDPC
jgi:hypothetical protein